MASITLKHPLIFDFNVNHEHCEKGDADSFIVAARGEPRKTEIRSSTKANDNIAVNRYGFVMGAVRRETGKEQMVKVHHGEGVANHIGPEPCVALREDGGEASAGERIGQPSSRESLHFPDADAVAPAEGHTDGRANASTRTIRRGLRPWHVRTLLGREPGDLASDRAVFYPPGPRREGEEP
jgi:hypothetical protein